MVTSILACTKIEYFNSIINNIHVAYILSHDQNQIIKNYSFFLVLVVVLCVSMYDAKIELVVFVLSLTGCGCDRYDRISRCQRVMHEMSSRVYSCDNFFSI